MRLIYLPNLLVVAGIVDPSLLLPLSHDEAVRMILPPYDRWEKQLRQRPAEIGDLTRQQFGGKKYRNFEFDQKPYFIMEPLAQKNSELEIIEIPFYPEFLGRTYHEID